MVEFKKAEVTEVTFPEDARRGFVKFVRQFDGRRFHVSPYYAQQEVAQMAALKMMELLVSSADEEAATIILDHIRAHQEGNVGEAIVIKNFPVDPKRDLLRSPTDTPYEDTPASLGKHGHVSEWALAAMNVLLGFKPLEEPNIQAGLRFHQIVPRKGKANMASNQGSSEFPWHNEANYRPDNGFMMLLVGLKNTRTPTLVASTDDVMAHLRANGLTDADVEIMRQSRFKHIAGVALNTGTAENVAPMLTTDARGRIAMRLNGSHDKIVPAVDSDTDAQRVIDKVAAGLKTLKQGVVLEHGTVVIFPNHYYMHSRTPVAAEDKIRGKERHLQRTQSLPVARESFREMVEGRSYPQVKWR